VSSCNARAYWLSTCTQIQEFAGTDDYDRLARPRDTSINEKGEYLTTLNIDGELPFGPGTFGQFADAVQFHDAGYARNAAHCQVVRAEQEGVVCECKHPHQPPKYLFILC
jgi:hypothetical protein